MNQIPTLTQIRSALHELAAKKNRPDYELCTAKEVKWALEHGIEHPLIKELPFFELEPKKVDKPVDSTVPEVKTHRVSKTRLAKQKKKLDPKKKQELIEWIKNYKGSLAEVGRLAQCSTSLFSHIKTGKRGFSFEVYTKIMKAREQLEGAAA
ncbi:MULTISPECIES: hypothetical protein [Acinetobacter]|uniref:hypothetical protein n=1 Tax=Acinetobacter TaxID=469 RepID=UPI000BDE7AC6|nr:MULTISPECIES: hypothetical protein [Acinetobacter]